MKKVLLVIGIIVLLLAAAAVALLIVLSKMPAVPEDYTETVPAGGELEAAYLAMGACEVGYYESGSLNSFEKYEIYYPLDIAQRGPLPVVVFVNGTGVKGSKYPALQKHMASWGFLTIATEEEFAWNGFSAEMCVRYLTALNDYQAEGEENLFCGKIDLDRVGVTGHSQGGTGVINAITDQRNADIYKAAVILSSGGNKAVSQALMWDYDETKIHAPTMLMAAVGDADIGLVTLEDMNFLFDNIPDGVMKVMARRRDIGHGEMLYYGDGYVTAWFMWLLQGDETAGGAFAGEQPEFMTNPMYQDQRASFPD